jgi:glycosyltransferase involved in cell wall biosynthesis
MTIRNSGNIRINGRFLSAVQTGVQRYAHQIVAALDPLLLAEGRGADLIVPTVPAEPLSFRATNVRRVGFGAGHLWEQTAAWSADDTLTLHLCNTAPVLGRRTILCIHDASVFTAPESYSFGFRSFYKFIQPLVARRTLKLATVSHHAGRQIVKHMGLTRSDIVVLPNGHEHTLAWRAERSTLISASSVRPYVLVIGSLARHKNIGLIVGLAEALDRLSVDVRIAGGSAAVFAHLPQADAANVVWLGRVTDDDLAGLLQNALCLAFPSFSEGFGIPALEAMALGCPVVASDSSSLPEVCGSAALYAAPDDAMAWLAQISKLVGSAGLQDELRAKGRAQAKLFSWAQSAQGYMDLIAKV